MKIESAELERLLDISALLTANMELGDVLTQVIKNAQDLMRAEASNVMLLDGGGRELLYEVALGEAGGAIKAQRRLKVGVGIAGWVAENRQALLIKDAYKDPRFYPEFDKKTGFRTKSILCLPLLARGKLIGVAQIINKAGGTGFTPEDQRLFTRFCNIAAVAIDNALLHRKKLEQDRLQRDMQLAEEIQRTSWPSVVPSFQNLRVEYRCLPCRHVGGDVLALNRFSDGRLAVLVADVSGKGVPAALFAAKFTSDFEYQGGEAVDGGALFTRLNRLVAARSTRGMFISAVYAVFDPSSGAVELVNAGHLEPVIVGPENGRARLARAPGGPPLGILDDSVYEAARIRLAPGATMVFLTDGVTDAKAPEGGRLGAEAVEKTLAERPTLAVARLMRKIRDFTSGQPPADDITVVGVGYGDYEEITLAAETASLAALRRFIETRLAGRGLGKKEAGRVLLAVTEAAANVIAHTYGSEASGKIRVGAGWRGPELSIHIRDWGPKQDPSRFSPRDLDDVRPGGLGLHFIQGAADAVEFDDSLFEGNELHFLFSGSEAPAQ